MAFNALINTIAPIPTPPDWVRPADWITITDTPNEVQFLVADTGAKAFAITTTFTRTSGNIYIDWGDGVTDTISTTTSTTTDHVYSTGGTPCSRGYNTFKIRIYGDATCVITNAQHVPNFAVTGGNPSYGIGLLEAYFGDNTCNTSAFNGNYFNSISNSTGLGSFILLEYVKLPATVAWTSQMSSMFFNCISLFVVVMPTSASSLGSLVNAFQNCINLLDISLPSNATGISSLSATFTRCTNLRTVSFPTTLNNCTTFNLAFSACNSLKNITLPSINLANDFTSAFQSCFSLQWFRFIGMPSPASPGTMISWNSMFSNCWSLQNVFFPGTCSSNARNQMNTMFSNCYNLKNIVFPTGFVAQNLGGTFQSCYSITNVTFPTAAQSMTNASGCFSNCFLLRTVDLPSYSGTLNTSSMFLNCISLPSITIPSGWGSSTMSTMFSGCSNLTSVTFATAVQNNCASMQSAFQNCIKLKTVVMPTSLNTCTNFSSTFSGCNELESITLPSTLPAVTNMNNCFDSCNTLTSITLPTNMSNCSSWGSCFIDCRNLISITMPSIISASTANFNSLVNGCISLRTLTLPTTQTSAVTSLSTMFYNAGNLTTINNLGNVGSLTATPLVTASINSGPSSNANLITSLSFNCPFSVLSVSGGAANNFNKLNSLRLLNTSAGQYTGTSPQINVSFSDLGIAALNQLFTDLPTVTSRTINITGCTGAAGCTRSIATAKGWIVTG
jgi:hypothetical protein